MPFLSDIELGKCIRENQIESVYFLYGKETFLSQGYLKKLIGKAVPKGTESFNLQLFDGAALDMVSLRVETEALPLMAQRKCVVLKNPNIEKLTKADFEELMEMVQDPNPTTVFIIFVNAYDLNPKKSAKVRKLGEAAAKSGVTVDFCPKTGSELIKIIKQRAAKAGSTIESPAASYLVERCGTSLEQLTVEIDKLTAYRPQTEITKKDIETVAGISLEASVFDLSKAMMQNNFNRAFAILDELFLCRQEPLAILAVLNMTFVDLYRAKTATLASKSVQDVCEIFAYKGKEFRMRNAFRDVPRYSVKTLRSCLEILAEADIGLKTSRTDGRIAVEKVLSSILQVINVQRS
ncbi:MAG: DNA polymerase III subunit delta [Clostridiales bacterium]|nr:MAG: DNA polymerase III subunit delta [Clostridiales bacterium]